jgi:hypothetical protein
VNLGDEDYWDSGQMTKNLILENPGFEGLSYRVIFHCDAVTGNSCTDDNQYNAQPSGFWVGGSYEVMSGNALGSTGTVTGFVNNKSTCAGCGPTITFDKTVNLAVGDYFSVLTYIPGSGDTGWWDNTSGGGTITTETTDLSPETSGKQALLLSALGTKSVSVTQYFDSYSNLSFIQMNGTYAVTFRAKGLGGNNQINVSVERDSTGNAPYVSQTLTLTNAWSDYTVPFSASENGTAVGTVQMVMSVTGANVEIDDVALQQTNSSTTNPTAFRDDVVNALEELNPGTIRMMGGASLGSDLLNQIQPPFGRYREGFNADGTSVSAIPYGIHEFLQLCQTVGSDPYLTIPTATTPAEMTDFIEYLTGNGSDPYSALRISRGQVAPWSSVFGKIHLELGNETWNGIFKGESMLYPGYPQWANTVFSAARQTPGFEASQFDLILSGWAAVPGYMSQELSTGNQQDSIDIAPYLLFSANDESQATMFGALFAEPELFDSAGGEVYRDIQAASAAASATSGSTNLNVYETNLSPIEGTITETELNALTPSVGAGIAHTEHMLQMMRLGVKYQNAFSLPQYQFVRSDNKVVDLWGIVVDMGTTNRRRPQFLTQALANSVIGGTMLQTSQTGANPTWNQPLSSDGVVFNGAHYLQSFAYLNGTTASVVLFNLNLTTALPVTFSGENAPTGTVQVTQITSANITDNNETSNVVQPTTQTLSSFNGSAGISLPPFSMTVLSWTSTFAQSPNFSVPAGTYSQVQSVALSSTTSGATIYYTTDGSTPTTSSTLYTSPITVSSTETINAIAVVSNLTASPVASALYTIQPVAASPVFTPGTGTYNANQAVTISDAVAGSTIYYTTDGSTPTTSSKVYAGPITVATSETLSAIAVAANYTNSAASSAVYTIAPPAPAPTFNVPTGTYQAAQIIQFADTLAGTVFYYTLDGSTPTTASAQYTGSVTVSKTATLKAIAWAPGYSNSAVTSSVYTIAPYAATPKLSVPAGTYSSPQSVTITDTTPGAVIYYTTDQTTPTTSSTLYGGPITIAGSVYLQAIAAAPGYTPSFVASALYTTTGSAVATPVISLASGTYSGSQTVTISDATSGALLYYTTNGTTPTSSSTPYSGAITVSSSETIQVIGIKSGYANSTVAAASYTISSSVATPVFSVAGGTYATTQTVSITDATVGATVYYTTNGSTPTTSSAVYSGPITVSSTETISAIAAAANLSNSSVASATYTIQAVAAAPVFSVAAGTYSTAQTVAISDATPGATIYYTTNGAAPTTSSSVYTGPITVSATETINAIAAGANVSSSAVTSATYTIQTTAATPVFSVAAGTYSGPFTVSISDSTVGASIYYSINGGAVVQYSAPITVSTSETINAIAQANNYANSAIASASYTIKATTATPLFSVASGTFSSAQTVSISDATAGAVIYYTTNGSTPTTSSAVYSGPITVGSSETIEAIAVAANYNSSAVASAVYTISTTAAMPVFSIAAGTYSSDQSVTITDATAGAVIYYTTNGATPTTASTKYSGAIAITKSETVKAVAVASGFNASSVASVAYRITARPPVFSVNPGKYSKSQAVAMSDATAGAVIYYTTDGSTPTTSSTQYASTITIKNSLTLKAIATAPEYVPSPVVTAAYAIVPVVDTPTFSLLGGLYSTAQTVALSDGTAGAAIYYTTNGSAPSTSSTKYTAPFVVKTNTTINAIAVLTGDTTSAVATAAYNIEAATPTFSVATGSYSAAQTVSVSDATSGAVIYYTTDGTAPTTSSTKYTVPIKVAASESIKAIAVAPGLTNSTTASATYTILTSATATPTFSVAGGTYSSAVTVSLADATSGAVIYYTTNGTTPATSSTKYTAPIKVTASETIEAIAVASGHSNSASASAKYTILTAAATPVFSVKAGTYATAQTVTITDATAGVSIYYTTNGTTPTTGSTKYTAAIKVSASETLKAIAASSSYASSAVASAAYAIETAAAAPVFSLKSGTYSLVQTVTLSDVTAGVTIYYTTNGSTPTTDSTRYTGPITVNTSETLKAFATSSSYSASAVATATYTLVTASPTFSHPGGTYSADPVITIADATTGATVYYTLDGSTPTKTSARYTGPITVGKSETLSAIAVYGAFEMSAVSTAKYILTAAVPSFSVASGTYSSIQVLKITDATPFAVIYYSTDGSAPTTASKKYTGPIAVGTSETIKAIGTYAYYNPSAVSSATYAFVAATPSFSVASGTYSSAQRLTISDATPNATIYFTLNGATPTTSSTRYTGPIVVNSTETVRSMATYTNFNPSGVTAASYTMEVSLPSFSLASGTYASQQQVAISDSTPGATIYFTTNGSTPTANSTKYTGPITVSSSETLLAVALEAGYQPSAVVTSTYVMEVAVPSFSVASGTYTAAQQVTISDATSGATIYYTTNGGIPSATSTKYTGPISVTSSEKIQAIAVDKSYSASPIAAASYTIN